MFLGTKKYQAKSFTSDGHVLISLDGVRSNTVTFEREKNETVDVEIEEVDAIAVDVPESKSITYSHVDVRL